VALAFQGHDDHIRARFTSPAGVAETELLGLHRGRPPMRLRDSPVPPAELRGWAEYLDPAGFRETLAVGLFAPDGRHLGMLALHTETAAHPTDAVRDLLGLLAPVLGHAVDPLRSITAAARIVRGAIAGVVLTRAGHPLPLPGLPTHPLLREGSALLTVAAQLAGGRAHAVFLCSPAGPDPAAGHLRVTVLACPTQPPHHLVAEITAADAELTELVTAAAPGLLSLVGVGTEVAGQLLTSAGDNPDRMRTEAAFAHLCGVAPVPASSGKTHRHRLNRGGDRGANNALYTIALSRLRCDPRTRRYLDRRTTEGLSKPEIIRCLKRYLAREVYHVLVTASPSSSSPPAHRPERAGQPCNAEGARSGVEAPAPVHDHQPGRGHHQPPHAP
jgi:hypothetical protein